MPTATAERIAQKTTDAGSLMKRACCLIVTTNSIGNSRRVSSSDMDINSPADLIRVQKTLLDSDELKALRSLDGEIRRYLYSRASQSPFTAGVYLLANALVPDVEDRLKEFANRRQGLVDSFILAYPDLIADARESLSAVKVGTETRNLFNPADYPSVSRVRRYFDMDWHYWSFETPDSLKGISQSFFEQEQEKAAQKWQQATDEVRQALRASFADLVSHMADRLSPKEDGKQKVFHKSMIANMNDFLETFKARNITDDADLDRLVTRAQRLVSGLSADDLRTQEGLRDAIKQGFDRIKTALDPMITDKPSRQIDLE